MQPNYTKTWTSHISKVEKLDNTVNNLGVCFPTAPTVPAPMKYKWA